MIRRLRLGNLRTLLRHRYGPVLPDDDAGRDDLRWLLLHVSAGPNAYLKMPRTIEVWAPWMELDEAAAFVAEVNCTPHLPTAARLGRELGVTNTIRERLKLWTIRACDMTAAQRRQWRRAKDRERKRRLRQARGSKPRKIYKAESKSKTKPWEKEGVSRAKWYRLRNKAPTNGGGSKPSAASRTKRMVVAQRAGRQSVEKQR
jgi:hypothetical protein